jgi:hypothetical protein
VQPSHSTAERSVGYEEPSALYQDMPVCRAASVAGLIRWSIDECLATLDDTPLDAGLIVYALVESP